MTYKLKFNYNGIFRRTSLESLSHESVEKAARQVFEIPDDLKVTLTWIDEEGDLVHVSSEQEFQEFMVSQSSPSIGRSSYMNGAAGLLYKFGVVAEQIPLSVKAAASATTHVDAMAGRAVHRGVSCDMCGVCPIVGNRYKCTGRDDYDLCAECELKAEHTFPMLKMYEPRVGVRLQVKGQGFFPRGHRRRGRCCPSSESDSGSIPPPAPFEGPAIHEGVTCNECGVGPIVGFRFKCTVRDEYDLCMACEALKQTQPYPMIKLYRPDISVQVKGWGTNGRQCRANPFGFANRGPRDGCNGPWRQSLGLHQKAASLRQTEVADSIATVIDTVADAAKSFMEDIDQEILKQTMDLSMEEAKKSDSSKPAASVAESNASSFAVGTVKGYALKPMARFVGDITIPDATIVAPSTDFVKIWLVRNDGPCDWPTFASGVHLVTAGGDPMCDVNLSIPVDSIKVGNETHISVTLKSPPTPGRYVAYFRLQAADGVVFGQKLWVDIRVQASPGNVGFTSPAFAVAKQAQQKETTSSEYREIAEVPLPVTHATASSTPPFIPAAQCHDSEVEMEFPGGDFEEVATVIPPHIPPEVCDVNAVVDEDAQWALEREDMERDWKVELDALRGMGFHNTRENVKLLKKHTKCSFSRFPQLQGKPFSDTLSTILDALLH